jgi:hypothetical protein
MTNQNNTGVNTTKGNPTKNSEYDTYMGCLTTLYAPWVVKVYPSGISNEGAVTPLETLPQSANTTPIKSNINPISCSTCSYFQWTTITLTFEYTPVYNRTGLAMNNTQNTIEGVKAVIFAQKGILKGLFSDDVDLDFDCRRNI